MNRTCSSASEFNRVPSQKMRHFYHFFRPSPPEMKTHPAYLAHFFKFQFHIRVWVSNKPPKIVHHQKAPNSNGPDSLCRACRSFMAGLSYITAGPSDGSLGGWVLGYYADVGKGQHHPIQWSNSEYQSLQQNSSRSNFANESRRYFEAPFSESLARPGKFLCTQPILCRR